MVSGEDIWGELSIGGCVSASGIKETGLDEIEIGIAMLGSQWLSS